MVERMRKTTRPLGSERHKPCGLVSPRQADREAAQTKNNRSNEDVHTVRRGLFSKKGCHCCAVGKESGLFVPLLWR